MGIHSDTTSHCPWLEELNGDMDSMRRYYALRSKVPGQRIGQFVQFAAEYPIEVHEKRSKSCFCDNEGYHTTKKVRYSLSLVISSCKWHLQPDPF